MNQETYNTRVKAFLAEMNARGIPPEDAAELLAQVEQTDKSAAAQHIAYKEARTPRQELSALHAAFKSARIDPDSDAGQQLEQLWIDEGLAVALGQVAQVARYKAEQAMGLNPNGLRSDTGRLLGAPIRDDRGRPLY